jgi:CubicO group peptidase (beta-lactamase class C family)
MMACPAACGAAPPATARIAAVEKDLGLERLMREHHVPGLSVAVIEDYRLAWAKGYGVTELGGATRVTPDTRFLAGSISKPVTAVGALRLVEQGRLALDADVNATLKTWKVPENDFTRAKKVTLERLLDHTAGFTGGDFFPGYAVGRPFPTLAQILDGSPPATNPPIHVGFPIGSKWHYSGDGYLVVQQLMMDATGESFPRLMREALFDRLDMRHSTFEQPLPDTLAASAAAGTLMDGNPVAGRWHVQPEMAAGGLWSTPSDLAKLAIELALSTRGKASHVVSQRMTLAMLSPHWSEGVLNILGTPRSPDAMGLGFFVGEGHRFGHIGGNVGYQSTLVMFGDKGNGVVIMTNSDVGLEVGNVLLDKIAKVYGWDYTAPPPP